MLRTTTSCKYSDFLIRSRKHLDTASQQRQLRFEVSESENNTISIALFDHSDPDSYLFFCHIDKSRFAEMQQA